jgi:hypothetical protein
VLDPGDVVVDEQHLDAVPAPGGQQMPLSPRRDASAETWDLA